MTNRPQGWNGQRLRAARTALSLSQRQLANLVTPPVTQSQVSHWEAGTSVPMIATIRRIQDALDNAAPPGQQTPTLMEFDSSTLAGLRRQRGLSQATLARIAGIPRMRVAEIEQGNPPTAATTAALASALEIDPSQLQQALPADRRHQP